MARAAAGNPSLAGDLFGTTPGAWRPMVLTFDAQRTFIEILDPDAQGFGRLTISMLDPSRQVPLLRYQTGDVARFLDRDHVTAALRAHGVAMGELPPALLALRGRTREALPNGAQVGDVQGRAVRQRRSGPPLHRCDASRSLERPATMHVQLIRGQKPAPVLERALLHELAADVRPSRVVLWPYARFPFGMGLDYERKFSYDVPGEPDR